MISVSKNIEVQQNFSAVKIENSSYDLDVQFSFHVPSNLNQNKVVAENRTVPQNGKTIGNH